jgi:selenide,water dikinase
VSGTVDPRALLTNAGGRAGDLLVLTKPLGVGAIVAGRKRGASSDALLASAIDTMTTLNAAAAAAACAADAHAMTDVTGFGLLGHLRGLARESGLAAELDAASGRPFVTIRALRQGAAGAGAPAGLQSR